MIKVRNKILFIPDSELSIAAAGDANSVTREFHIDRMQPDGIDLANLHFRLDIRYTDTDTTDTALLDLTVKDTELVLTWTVQADTSAHPGSLFVNIRAFNDDGIVRWSSFQGAFYVENTVGGGTASSSQLSELEEMEKRYDETTKKLHEDMDSLKNMERTATSYAVGGVLNDDGSPFREGQDEDNAKYYAEKSKEQAEASKDSADASALSATEASASSAEALKHSENAAISATNASAYADAAKKFSEKSKESAQESKDFASKSEASAEKSKEQAAASEDSAAASEASAGSSDLAATRSSESAAAAADSASKSASSARESKEHAAASNASAEASKASAKESEDFATAARNSAGSAASSAEKAETLINTNGLATIYIDKAGHMIYEAANGALLDFQIADHKNLEVKYG